MLEPNEMNDSELEVHVSLLNDAYRSGMPEVSDHDYDHIWIPALQARNADAPILNSVESEPEEAFLGADKVAHPIPMLSTNKVYDVQGVADFVKRVQKAAIQLGMNDVKGLLFKLTPKLDGMAGRQLNGQLVSRGESKNNEGFDISSLFKFGIEPAIEPGGTLSVVGEIVCNQEYFDTFLQDDFEHPRGVVVGLASSAVQNGTPNYLALQAAQDGAIKFITYDQLHDIKCTGDVLVDCIDEMFVKLTTDNCPYPTDGIVLEVMDEKLKQAMGHNNQYHRWQIAKKVMGEQKEANVIGIEWQTARSSVVSPVVIIEPTEVSGCVIERPTGHHAGRIMAWGIGAGARILVERRGSVIPHIAQIIHAVKAVLPTQCPSCNEILEWREAAKKDEKPKFLFCPNTALCPAQTECRIEHFFKILGTVNGFGPSVIHELVDSGFETIPMIYQMDMDEMLSAGISHGIAQNLLDQLEQSKAIAIPDWRLTGAVGMHFLGRGLSRRMLEHVNVFNLDSVDEKMLLKVDKIGAIKAKSIAKSIAASQNLLNEILDINFNLEITPLLSEKESIESPIAGKGIVFTGSMQTGTRSEMESMARSLGSNVQSGISKNTSWLVCGAKVGASKTAKAEKLGVTIISEQDYLQLIEA